MNDDIKDRLWDAEGILFDLDNTLYPREKGVFDRINERINLFVMDLTGECVDDVRIMRKDYIGRYGTTLGGLMKHFDVHPDEYLDYVHDVRSEEHTSELQSHSFISYAVFCLKKKKKKKRKKEKKKEEKNRTQREHYST